MSRTIRLSVLLALVSAGLLCSGLSRSDAARASNPTGAPYKIGAIFAVTGDASSLGIPERNTAQMLEKMINDAGGVNGRPIQIIIEDNRGQPAEALSAAKRLVEREEVLAIVGPSRTGDSLALVSYMEKVKVPLISCAAGIQIVEPVKDWIFKTPQSDRMAVQRIIGYLKEKKITRVASLSDNTGFGKGGLDELKSLLPKAGIKLVISEEYGPKDSSMATQVTKIRRTNAQALICWGTPPGPAIVAKNMKQLGVRIPLLCSHGVANATFLNLAGDAANGVVLPAGRLIVVDQTPASNPQKKVLTSYANAYQARFDKPADTFGGHAWDGVQLVVDALREVGPDRAKIRAKIENTKNFVGTGGVFNFSAKDHNGLTADAFVMVEVRNGKWQLLK